jgi:hypothetical protein
MKVRNKKWKCYQPHDGTPKDACCQPVNFKKKKKIRAENAKS